MNIPSKTRSSGRSWGLEEMWVPTTTATATATATARGCCIDEGQSRFFEAGQEEEGRHRQEGLERC